MQHSVDFLDSNKNFLKRSLVNNMKDVIEQGKELRVKHNSKIYVKLPLELFAQMVAANEFSDGLVFMLNEEQA